MSWKHEDDGFGRSGREATLSSGFAEDTVDEGRDGVRLEHENRRPEARCTVYSLPRHVVDRKEDAKFAARCASTPSVNRSSASSVASFFQRSYLLSIESRHIRP
jgi:hypothetical protein